MLLDLNKWSPSSYPGLSLPMQIFNISNVTVTRSGCVIPNGIDVFRRDHLFIISSICFTRNIDCPYLGAVNCGGALTNIDYIDFII